MARIVVSDLCGDARHRQLGRDEQRLCLADAPPQDILKRRIAGHILADVREVVRTDVQRVRHALKREILGKMPVDVVLDALREYVFSAAAVLRGGGEELLHERQQRHQQMMRAVVVACGQLAVQHIIQLLETDGLRLGQRADRRGVVRDERVFAQSGYAQTAERQTERGNRPVGTGRLIVHHAAVIDEQVAPARVIRHAADEITALAAAHEHDLHQIVMRVHDARMRGCLCIRPADGKQARRPGQPERRLIFLFDKTLYQFFRPFRLNIVSS